MRFMRHVTHFISKAVLVASLVNLRVSAQSEFPIYTDSLDNGFQDWNSAPHNLTNTLPVHWGTHSIEVNAATSWQGISFYHSDLDTSPYSTVSFWVNGGTNGGQRLQIQAKVGPGNPEPNVYHRFTAPADGWRQIIVPLASLGAADKTNLTGIWIQLVSGSPTNPFYVDDVQFNPKPVPITVLVPAAAPTVTRPASAAEPVTAVWWICGALAVIIGLLVWLAVMFRKSSREKTSALLPATVVPAPVADAGEAGSASAAGSGDWQQRALAAEALARNQAEILREKVGPELTAFAKGALVQGLYSHQNALIEVERRAQQELMELEARLARLHLPLAERIQVYERRIAELEKQMSVRNDEMRELTSATLQLVRQRLAEEKQREPETRFN
jgi:hypothetical protein